MTDGTAAAAGAGTAATAPANAAPPPPSAAPAKNAPAGAAPATAACQGRSDWKEVGYGHFLRVFAGLDITEIAARCALPLEDGRLIIRFMGDDYAITPGEFTMTARNGAAEAAIAERMLVLRYLCEGVWRQPGAGALSYREVPWGETYFANFEGRCIKRLARTYTANPDAFCSFFENAAALRAVKLEKKTGWRFEFLTNLFFTFIIWPGDEEFPTQAQILFDDNIPAAFSAEDLAVAGDCALSRIKTALSGERRA